MSKATATPVNEIGQRKPVSEMRVYLDKLKPQLALALPRHLNADRMARLVLTQFSVNPALQDCTMQSIAACVMTASQLGLEIGVGGQCYMVPYGKTATFVPGWKGLIDLVSRAGRASVWTGAVFEGDVFDWELGANPYLKHKPMGESDPQRMIAAYAIGKVNGADCPIIECWTNERIKKHFKKNVVPKLQSSHYSNKHWEMYARKVVLLQVLKYLPQSIELQAATQIANAEDSGKSIAIDSDWVTIEQQVEPERVEQAGSLPRPTTTLPTNASEILGIWWEKQAKLTTVEQLQLCSDEITEADLSVDEKRLVWAEITRRIS